MVIFDKPPATNNTANTADERLEILKDFYDGQPVNRRQIFWEVECDMVGWTATLEAMTEKYSLKIEDVLHKLNDLDNQYLIYSPNGRSTLLVIVPKTASETTLETLPES